MMMSRILIVAATAQEVGPFLSFLEKSNLPIDVEITGVGMVATAFALGEALHRQVYDLVINVGIAGAFSKELSLGELVFVECDCLVELGAEDGSSFLSIENLGLGISHYQWVKGNTGYWLQDLKSVNGITVNTVHGDEKSIKKINQRYTVAVESMEGAAVYYACNKLKVPCIQVRCISNYVEKRNKGNWKIGEAIKELNDWLISKMTFEIN
ncbi:futalosine hydrolase [Olivibacter sp. SDN3]|uniref:futalosine hydrolase n=1 Tax=Olivibacter sp. SDN3 TaxID=2764720 RepID=UPI001650D931|nr:futalosine hydrolase [Olivibacter sp. SDN3]QNL51136.1 futalosine hydrolase [Olivibacter sp. SDN3]